TTAGNFNLSGTAAIVWHALASSSRLVFSACLILLATILLVFLSAMDVDSQSNLSAPAIQEEYLPVETSNVDGESFSICRPNSAQPQETIILPELYRDGVFYVMYQNIHRLRRADLVQLCKAYNLGANENMEILRGKLVGFSENLVRWKVIIPGATRAHRGVREGKITKAQPSNKGQSSMAKKKAKAKLSTLRRNDLMGFSSLDQPSVAVVKRSKDMRTLEQKNNMLKLCEEYVRTHPYIPPEERDRRERARLEAKKQASDMAVFSAQFEMTNRKLDGLTSLVGSIFQGWPTSSPGALSQPALHLFPSMPAPSMLTVMESPVENIGFAIDAASPPFPSTTLQAASAVTQDNVAAQQQSQPKSTTVDTTLMELSADPTALGSSHGMEFRLEIGHGQVITYTEDNLRTPNQMSFAGDIERLNRVWDDEGPDWDPVDCSNLLSLNGIPIAVRHWRNAFSGKKDSKRWKAMKGCWTEWKAGTTLINLNACFTYALQTSL
ncbi:hypothetical protein EV361DRAFT_975338, partial [Lentinula raphanica]